MTVKKSEVADLINSKDFPWRLRCMMALADIQGGELEWQSGIHKKKIYRIRAGWLKATPEVRERLVLAIEKWRPGTIDMIRAAERCGVKFRK